MTKLLLLAALLACSAWAQPLRYIPESLTLTNTNGIPGFIAMDEAINAQAWSNGITLNATNLAANMIAGAGGINATTATNIANARIALSNAALLFQVTNIVNSAVTTATNNIDAGFQRRSANTNIVSRSLVTVINAANGFQLSATRDADVSYSFTQDSSSTLTGGAAGYIVLEAAPTNSPVASLWVEKSKTRGGQANGLIVGLSLLQQDGGPVHYKVPAGYYIRLRSVNTTGTPTWTFSSGWEAVE